jgi:hypothetical protein
VPPPPPQPAAPADDSPQWRVSLEPMPRIVAHPFDSAAAAALPQWPPPPPFAWDGDVSAAASDAESGGIDDDDVRRRRLAGAPQTRESISGTSYSTPSGKFETTFGFTPSGVTFQHSWRREIVLLNYVQPKILKDM